MSRYISSGGAVAGGTGVVDITRVAITVGRYRHRQHERRHANLFSLEHRQEVGAHLVGRLVPGDRVLSHRLGHHRVQRRRYVGVERAGKRGFGRDVLEGNGHRAVTGVGVAR